MSKRFLTNINLEKNEIQNVVIHKLATAPSNPFEGQVYYNTGDQRYYLRLTSSWKDVSGRIDDILTGTNAITITDNSDGTLTIDIANVTDAVAGLMSPADKNLLDGATNANTASALVKRNANGDVSFTNVNIANAPTSSNHAATKGYVDSLAASGLQIKGVIDASSNPDYPAAAIGDAYHVSVAGRVGGVAGDIVEQGDMLVAVAVTSGGDEATVGDDWITMQSNIGASTETIAGYIQIATTAEVSDGINDTKAVTPSKMAAYVASLITAGKYVADVGTGSLSTIVITHGLNTSDVIVQLHDNSTKEVVEADVELTNSTTVTLRFNVAPALNAYRVTISG